MNLIICIDDAGGMMFNHRRQSQDRVLRARLGELSKDTKLWVTPYTARQFTEGVPVCVSDKPWLDAGAGEYYFAEDGELGLDRAERVYLYRWNRLYPSDRKFDPDLALAGFSLCKSEEFEGYSHENITEELYIKES